MAEIDDLRSELANLRQEVETLRRNASTADSNLALIIGIVAGGGNIRLHISDATEDTVGWNQEMAWRMLQGLDAAHAAKS